MARLRNPNPTRYDLTIGARGAMRLPAQPRGMTYHHIIPFNQLREFWNTGVSCDLEVLRETLVPALINSMADYPLDEENPARAAILVDSATRLLRMVWMGNYVHDPGAVSPAGIDDFNSVYTWLPGNLFSGPTIRPDDPEDRFDSFANRCVEEGRYLDVLRAHRAIQAYLGQIPAGDYTADAAGTRARARVAHLAHTAGLSLARVAAYADATPHDPSDWR
jgi:hypothetical protein